MAARHRSGDVIFFVVAEYGRMTPDKCRQDQQPSAVPQTRRAVTGNARNATGSRRTKIVASPDIKVAAVVVT